MNDLSIIPECYIDTNLIETLVPPQSGYNHQKGCGTVSNRMKGRMADTFAIGIIDKDKKDLDYLDEFDEVIHCGGLYVFKHQNKHHYIIQICPAIERFILENAANAGIYLPDYNLPETLSELKKISKVINSKKDVRFKRLFKDILLKGSKEFKILAAWISCLKITGYSSETEALKQLCVL